MLQPIIYNPPNFGFTQPSYEYYKSLDQDEKKDKSTFCENEDDFNQKELEKEIAHGTNSKFEIEPEGENNNLVQELPDYSSLHSTQYIHFQCSLVLGEIKNEMDRWLEKGSELGLTSVVNIKRILENKSDYFDQNQNTRLLLSIIGLIFRNNSWDSMPLNKVKFLDEKIKYLSNTELNHAQISKFVREIHTSKIKLLKGNGNQEA
ncbi:MAG: hypothetical protein PHX34_03950 [Candidatus Shapirobacteria bacterium]|nr:hypothetical protein [Candidatus Shapirobacteria bacterium]